MKYTKEFVEKKLVDWFDILPPAYFCTVWNYCFIKRAAEDDAFCNKAILNLDAENDIQCRIIENEHITAVEKMEEEDLSLLKSSLAEYDAENYFEYEDDRIICTDETFARWMAFWRIVSLDEDKETVVFI